MNIQMRQENTLISTDQTQENVSGLPSTQVHISAGSNPEVAPVQSVPPEAMQAKLPLVQVGVPLLEQVIAFKAEQARSEQVNVLPEQVHSSPVVAPTQVVPPEASQEKVPPLQVGVPLLVQEITFEPSQDSV